MQEGRQCRHHHRNLEADSITHALLTLDVHFTPTVHVGVHVCMKAERVQACSQSCKLRLGMTYGRMHVARQPHGQHAGVR